MKTPIRCLIALAGIVSTLSINAGAHVPYLERRDITPEQPFAVERVEQSIAVYGWLQKTNDVDTYVFSVTGTPTRLFVELLVPVHVAYLNFLPSFAVIGPGLPAATEPLPFEIPKGQGVLVFDHESAKRPLEYEPFGGKWYFVGPELDDTVTATGTWQVVVWNRDGKRGDYTLAIGYEENFAGPDAVRALVNTKIIRENGELHVPVRKSGERP